jgi:hypothetical protein
VSIWLPVSLATAVFVQAATSPHQLFDGTWRLDAARSESAAASESTEPLIVEIRQSDREVAIATTQGDRHNQVVHGFVASPTTPYSVDGAAGRAYWDGEALVTEGTRLVQGQTVATRETRRLNRDSSEMTVEVVVIVQHGYDVRGGRNYGIGRDVYTRVAR